MPVIQKSPPELRLPEFSGAWNHGVLGDCIESLNAGVSVLSSDIPTSKGQKRILKTSCVSSGFFDPSENKLVDDAGQIKRLKEHVCRETIVISRMNTPELVGANAYVQNTDKSLFLPDRLWAAKIDLKYSSRWIAILLSGPKLRATLSARATGTSNSMKNISKADVKSIRIYYPSKEEQQKIAAFLSSVDTKIEQLNKKKALLEQYKKGMMQKLFSQEIRFKDELGRDYPDWESKELKQIAKIFRGMGLSKSAVQLEGKFPCVLYGELFTKYAETIKTVLSFTNEKTSATSQCGDILMPTSDVTPSGLATASTLLVENVQLGGDINIIRLNKGISPIFMSYLINFCKKVFMRLVTGTTVKHIYAKDIQHINFSIPTSQKEQQNIANFLSAIDKKIELVAEQLTQAQIFKKGLLQQMFI